MKKYAIILPLLACFIASGCGNTASGMKEDSAAAGTKSAASAQNLSNGIQEAGKDMGAATLLTPKVKTAIMADARLNDPKNVVNVDATPEKVTLSGHVISEELKTLATSVAKQAVTDAKATQPIENNLVVSA